jgi:GNAT superfamily N-acetyltransferase
MPWRSNYCGGVTSVRSATLDEVRAVQLAVLRPHGPLPGDQEPPADWVHLAADSDGTVIGACSVGPNPWPHPQLCALPAPQWQLRSMAVLPERRGGVGAALLVAAVEQAWAGGAASLWAQARVEALRLYLRGGWSVVGEEWLKPGIGPHRWITLIPG